jgi:hypothetical protein
MENERTKAFDTERVVDTSKNCHSIIFNKFYSWQKDKFGYVKYSVRQHGGKYSVNAMTIGNVFKKSVEKELTKTEAEKLVSDFVDKNLCCWPLLQ